MICKARREKGGGKEKTVKKELGKELLKKRGKPKVPEKEIRKGTTLAIGKGPEKDGVLGRKESKKKKEKKRGFHRRSPLKKKKKEKRGA